MVEDTDDDGTMDKTTVFLDSLVLPRSVKVLEQGVLVAARPSLLLARDTNGDLKADTNDVAPLVYFLLSDGTSFIAGRYYLADGGYTTV